MKISDPKVTVTETFQCSASVLWRALSQHKQMIEWYFDNIPKFEAEVGFATRFQIENEGRVFTHRWEVIKAIPNQRLAYGWRYEEYPGDAIVHFSLSGSNPVALLVEMEIVEDFPSGIPEFELDSCQGGWDYFIRDSLAAYIKSLA